MLDVTQATREAYENFGTSKELTISINNHTNSIITLTNTDIVAQSLNLTERLETGENLTFTGCIASVLQFKCRDIDVDIKGADVACSIKADNTEVIPLFHGIIDDVTNTSHEQATMSITAYDKLYSLSDVDMKSWYDTLLFPMTLQAFRNSLFTYLYSNYGLQQKDSYLINDDMLIYQGIDSENIACLDLLKWLCQINGNYGRIDRYGKFEYLSLNGGLFPSLTLYPSDDLYPSITNIPEPMDKSYYTSIDFENYSVQKITRINLRGKDDRIIASAGSGSNIWNVNTNPYVWGYEDNTLLEPVVQKLLDEVSPVSYIPLNHLDLTGLPYIETGDFITVEAKRSTINTFVFERNLVGTQALKDSFLANGSQNYPVYKPNIQTQTEITKNTVEEVSNSVTEIDETVNNLDEVVNELSGEIENKQNVLTAGDGIDITNDVISVTNPITLGTTDLTPGVSPLPTGHIYFVYE